MDLASLMASSGLVPFPVVILRCFCVILKLFYGGEKHNKAFFCVNMHHSFI